MSGSKAVNRKKPMQRKNYFKVLGLWLLVKRHEKVSICMLTTSELVLRWNIVYRTHTTENFWLKKNGDFPLTLYVDSTNAYNTRAAKSEMRPQRSP